MLIDLGIVKDMCESLVEIFSNVVDIDILVMFGGVLVGVYDLV